MNANRMINMVIRIVMRKLVGRGVNAGLGAMSRRGKNADAPQSEADRAQGRAARKQGKRARQAMRATRRATRF